MAYPEVIPRVSSKKEIEEQHMVERMFSDPELMRQAEQIDPDKEPERWQAFLEGRPFTPKPPKKERSQKLSDHPIYVIIKNNVVYLHQLSAIQRNNAIARMTSATLKWCEDNKHAH